MNNGIVRKQRRVEEYLREQDKDLEFSPTINMSSRKMNRDLTAIHQDTHQWLSKKQQIENNLKVVPKVSGIQIGAQSDKVIHDRFDQEFNRACLDLGIIKESQQADDYNEDVRVDCAQMSKLFL